MIRLTPEPLTQEAFEPFGTVLQRADVDAYPINEGTTTRYNALSHVDPGVGGEVIVSIFAGTRRPDPIAIRMLERHPLGDQVFWPLGDADWLVVVAPGEAPAARDCRCFRARGDQGVRYAANVWHHPLLTLQPAQDFLVLDRRGPGENLQETFFDEAPAMIEGM
jgi:ureidoglycolate lyase